MSTTPKTDAEKAISAAQAELTKASAAVGKAAKSTWRACLLKASTIINNQLAEPKPTAAPVKPVAKAAPKPVAKPAPKAATPAKPVAKASAKPVAKPVIKK